MGSEPSDSSTQFTPEQSERSEAPVHAPDDVPQMSLRVAMEHVVHSAEKSGGA